MATKKGLPQLLIALCALVSTTYGCRREEVYCIMPETVELQTGDVVFRLGTTMESRTVVLADEGLLLPFLAAYQPDDLNINATMGFPVAATPVFSLLRQAMFGAKPASSQAARQISLTACDG